MALPILESAKFETVIPSTKKRIEYRPFLVKEEKILLMAQESKDPDQILRALKDIIYACTFEKVKVDDLAIYDMEYIFLQLRAKSVGETVDLQLKCSECGKDSPAQLDITSVKVQEPAKKVDPKIELTESIGIVARPVPVKEIGKVSDKAEDFVKMIALCIESIYDSDNVYHRKDVSEKELLAFVESLSRKQVEKIEEFIVNQPKLSHLHSFECINCKAKNTVTIEGLQSFFK